MHHSSKRPIKGMLVYVNTATPQQELGLFHFGSVIGTPKLERVVVCGKPECVSHCLLLVVVVDDRIMSKTDC